MGYGDSLWAAGLAQEAFSREPGRGPVLICNCAGKPRYMPEWVGNPAILSPYRTIPADVHRLLIGKGCLPYYPWSRETTWRARDHMRATLYFTKSERKRGLAVLARWGEFALIEPPGVDRKNSNRKWHGWARLASILKERLDLPLLQLEHEHIDRLPGIQAIPHNNFRDALAVLKVANCAVLTEGGIAIGAASVGTPSVVVWGGNSSCETAGYPEHINIVDDDPESPCGRTKPCDHCAAAWARLTPEFVADAFMTLRQQTKAVQ